MSGRIVVGVDGSDESRVALRFAFDDAARRAARVEVVRAFPTPEYWAVAYGMAAPVPLDEIRDETERATRALVDDVVAGLGRVGSVPVDVVAAPGAPARVLLDAAQGADLLVVGHRGRGGIASAMLGSVGLHCVLHAPCPVTVVRPAAVPASRPAAEVAAAVPVPL